MNHEMRQKTVEFLVSPRSVQVKMIRSMSFDELPPTAHELYIKITPVDEMPDEALLMWAKMQVSHWPVKLTPEERAHIIHEMVESNKLMARKSMTTQQRLAQLEDAKRKREENEARRREERIKERERKVILPMPNDIMNMM